MTESFLYEADKYGSKSVGKEDGDTWDTAKGRAGKYKGQIRYFDGDNADDAADAYAKSGKVDGEAGGADKKDDKPDTKKGMDIDTTGGLGGDDKPKDKPKGERPATIHLDYDQADDDLDSLRYSGELSDNPGLVANISDMVKLIQSGHATDDDIQRATDIVDTMDDMDMTNPDAGVDKMSMALQSSIDAHVKGGKDKSDMGSGSNDDIKADLRKNPEKLDDMSNEELEDVFPTHEEYQEFEDLRNQKVLKDKHPKLHKLASQDLQAEKELESLEQELKDKLQSGEFADPFVSGKKDPEGKKKFEAHQQKIQDAEQKREDASNAVYYYQQDNADALDADNIPYDVKDLVKGEEKKKDESFKVINGVKYRPIKESVNKRVTVKEVKSWLKGLEEFRYRKIPNVDARRITSFVNNGLSETDLPQSLQKKWGNAKYSREKHLADKFVKERISKKLARNESNHPIKEQYDRLFKNKVVL